MRMDRLKTCIKIYLIFDCQASNRDVSINDEFEDYAWVRPQEYYDYDLSAASRVTLAQKDLIQGKVFDGTGADRVFRLRPRTPNYRQSTRSRPVASCSKSIISLRESRPSSTRRSTKSLPSASASFTSFETFA